MNNRTAREEDSLVAGTVAMVSILGTVTITLIIAAQAIVGIIAGN